MNRKKAIRVALDVLLTVMIVLEMLIQLTGETLHEIIGFAFFVTVLIHVLLSGTWVKKTARVAKSGKLTAHRAALAAVGISLAIATLVLAISSIAISNILASAGFTWPFGAYALWSLVHTASAYALCALVVVHLAMHWIFLFSAFKVPYNPARRKAISTGVNTIAAIGVIALGVTAADKMLQATANASSTAQNTESSNEASSTNPATSSKGKRKGESTPAEGSTTNASAASNSNSAGATGICTLCKKQCPLSSPKCDKPYDAGLI